MMQQKAFRAYQSPGVKACLVKMLLYGSEPRTLDSRQEHRLDAFHMQRLRRIL
jgi:hypothetical protein